MPPLLETTLISLDGQVHEPMRFAAPYFDADAVEVLDGQRGLVIYGHGRLSRALLAGLVLDYETKD